MASPEGLSRPPVQDFPNGPRRLMRVIPVHEGARTNMDARTISRRPLSVAVVFLGALVISGALWLLEGQSQPAYTGHLPTHQFPSATVKVSVKAASVGRISLGASPR